MKVSAVTNNLLSHGQSLKFKGKEKNSAEKNEYYNPVSVKTERRLAVLTSAGESALGGAVIGGIGYLIADLANGNKSAKIAATIAAAIAGIAGTLALVLPSKLYHTNVSATVKSKEMEVFTRDKELKKDLTENVHQEVKDPDISLDKKLDDNLKLQLANKGLGLGIANI